jgi:hypothetical protein
MTCPGFERLIDHLDGRLEAAAAEAVAAHLASGCEQCASDRTWYESVRRVTAADDSIEPPPWVLKRAVKVFDGARNRSGLSARLGSIIATLVYDSLGGPVPAGARTTEWTDHQLLYRADDFNIDLLLESSDQQMSLRGQILREGESLFESTSGISLELIREGQLVHSTSTNEVGEFTIPAIELGQYDLRIEAAEVSITVAGLAIV